MNNRLPPSPIRRSDYEAIEAALLESARGRWFLSEYSRRNRTADTQMLLDAITKLEAALMLPAGRDDQDRIRRDLIEMSEAIAQTRREIAAIKAPNENSRLTCATEELGAIVEATERATSDILEAAEDVQETAWLLREQGVEEATCDRLDQRATDIYTACSFQDITGQRTGKVVDILRYLEKRVNSMVDIWGLDGIEVRHDPAAEERPDSHLLNGPQLEGRGLKQDDIDDLIGLDPDDITVVETGPEARARQPLPEAWRIPGEIAATGEAAELVPTAYDLAFGSPPEEPAQSPTGDVQSVAAAATQAPADDIGDAAVPSQPALPAGTVRAGEFSAPGELTVNGLDQAKTAALFN